MEIIPEEAIEIYQNFCIAESLEQYKEFFYSFAPNQKSLVSFMMKASNQFIPIDNLAQSYQLLSIVMRCFRYYDLEISTITERQIEYKEDLWKQRIRKHRNTSREDLMAYVKTEIKQTFLVEYVFRILNDEGKLSNGEDNYFTIEDKDFLLKAYSALFTLIDLMDEEIGKIIEA